MLSLVQTQVRHPLAPLVQMAMDYHRSAIRLARLKLSNEENFPLTVARALFANLQLTGMLCVDCDHTGVIPCLFCEDGLVESKVTPGKMEVCGQCMDKQIYICKCVGVYEKVA